MPRDPRALLATVADAAAALGVSEKHIRRLIDDKALPVVRIRRAVRVPWDAVDRLAASHPAAEPANA